MIVDFRLQVFQKVATLLSFSKAAAELEISQPAVSKHIFELENSIGDILFIRRPTSISLTEKGKILLDYTDKILHLYNCLNEELVPKPQTKFDDLRIAACPLAYNYFLTPILEKFNTIYPTIRITLLERSDDLIEKIIEDDEADLGISELPSSILNSTLFASINISGGNSLKRLFILSPEKTKKKELLNHFLLTSKTLY